MDNPGYVALTRMQGLADELRVVANNVANLATGGYRAEGVIFAEVMVEMPADGGALSMAQPRARMTDLSGGGLAQTGGQFDLAIAGPGFFMVEGPGGPRLTRAGAFAVNGEGLLVTATTGAPVLDEGGAPIAVPEGAGRVAVAEDGTMSADGEAFARIGVFDLPPEQLVREDGVTFRPEAAPAPLPEGRVAQGFVEMSNVSPVEELARMIEVQRAYELGQSFLDLEDQRQREAVRTIGRVG